MVQSVIRGIRYRTAVPTGEGHAPESVEAPRRSVLRRAVFACSLAAAAFLALPASGQSTAFFRELLPKKVTSARDACMVMAHLALNADELQKLGEKPDFKALREALLGKGVIAPSWKYSAGDRATAGMAAEMLCRTLGIKGGITMRLTGMSERYALRECRYVGLVLKGGEWRRLSGRELIAILARAKRFRDGEVQPSEALK